MPTPAGFIELTRAASSEKLHFNPSHIVQYGAKYAGFTIVQDVTDRNGKEGTAGTLVVETGDDIAALIVAAQSAICGELISTADPQLMTIVENGDPAALATQCSELMRNGLRLHGPVVPVSRAQGTVFIQFMVTP